MKLVVPVRLYPGAADEAALRDTRTLCNQAVGLVSVQAFEMRVTSGQSLQSIRAGNLGEPGSKRRARAESKPIAFRADAHSLSMTGACPGSWTAAP